MGAYASFYSAYNDVDIYVEDRNLAGLYERVFTTLLPQGMKITAVIAMNGKLNVISEAKRLKSNSTRKRFFLVDGDFDWILDRSVRLKNLYYLKCYSFENFAWNLHALRNVAHSLAPNLTSSQIDGMLNLAIMDQIVKQLYPLFLVYALCAHFLPTQQTTAFAIERLLEKDTRTNLCKVTIRQRIKILMRAIRTSRSPSEIRQIKTRIAAKITSKNRHPSTIISGKDYLIKYMMFKFQDNFHYRGNKDQLLCLTLAQSDLSIDPQLKRSFLKAIK